LTWQWNIVQITNQFWSFIDQSFYRLGKITDQIVHWFKLNTFQFQGFGFGFQTRIFVNLNMKTWYCSKICIIIYYVWKICLGFRSIVENLIIFTTNRFWRVSIALFLIIPIWNISVAIWARKITFSHLVWINASIFHLLLAKYPHSNHLPVYYAPNYHLRAVFSPRISPNNEPRRPASAGNFARHPNRTLCPQSP